MTISYKIYRGIRIVLREILKTMRLHGLYLGIIRFSTLLLRPIAKKIIGIRNGNRKVGVSHFDMRVTHGAADGVLRARQITGGYRSDDHLIFSGAEYGAFLQAGLDTFFARDDVNNIHFFQNPEDAENYCRSVGAALPPAEAATIGANNLAEAAKRLSPDLKLLRINTVAMDLLLKRRKDKSFMVSCSTDGLSEQSTKTLVEIVQKISSIPGVAVYTIGCSAIDFTRSCGSDNVIPLRALGYSTLHEMALPRVTDLYLGAPNRFAVMAQHADKPCEILSDQNPASSEGIIRTVQRLAAHDESVGL